MTLSYQKYRSLTSKSLKDSIVFVEATWPEIRNHIDSTRYAVMKLSSSGCSACWRSLKTWPVKPNYQYLQIHVNYDGLDTVAARLKRFGMTEGPIFIPEFERYGNGMLKKRKTFLSDVLGAEYPRKACGYPLNVVFAPNRKLLAMGSAELTADSVARIIRRHKTSNYPDYPLVPTSD